MFTDSWLWRTPFLQRPKWMKKTLDGQLHPKQRFKPSVQQVYTITAKAILLIIRPNSRPNGRWKITHLLNLNVKNQNDVVVYSGSAAVSAVIVLGHIAYVMTHFHISYEVHLSGRLGLTRFLLHCRIINNNISLHLSRSTWPKVELDWIYTVIPEGIYNFWKVTSFVRVVTTTKTSNRRKKDCPP